MKHLLLTTLLTVIPLTPALVGAAEAERADLILILDASGSMWGQVDGKNKIVIAREVLGDTLGRLDAQRRVGLVAYGHRHEGDCADIETLSPVRSLQAATLRSRVDTIQPKGKTPIAGAFRHALGLLGDREGPATIVLVSDGLETCGGDPCKAVAEARASGVEFVMHVVGFDLGDDDVSQLECAAQAGGGLYFDARNAAQLGEALQQAVVDPPPAANEPTLTVKVVANDALQDATVRIHDLATDKEVAAGRTYSSAETNPRRFSLVPGRYRAQIQAVGLEGDVRRTLEPLEIQEGEVRDEVVDFSRGELAVRVTRNGELSDASVHVTDSTTGKPIAQGRSYRSAKSNPRVFSLTAGTYDVEIGALEIKGKPEHRFESVLVPAKDRVSLEHAWSSGTLRVLPRMGEQIVDCAVNVRSATGQAVAGGRSYDRGTEFILEPGAYRLHVKAVRIEGNPEFETELSITAGEVLEPTIRLDSP